MDSWSSFWIWYTCSLWQKHTIFSAYCSKCCFYFSNETYPHSSADEIFEYEFYIKNY